MSDVKKPSSISRSLLIFVLVAAVGFGALLFFKRDALTDTWSVLKDVNPFYIALLPIIQIINYSFIGYYYQQMFGLFGASFGMKRAWGVVAAMNFVNQVLPSGGLSGITYLAYGFRSKLKAGKVTLIQIGRYVGAFLSYTILMPLALLFVAVSGTTSEFEDVASRASHNQAALITVGIFILLVIATMVVVLNKKLTHAIGGRIGQLVNWARTKLFHREGKWQFTAIRNIVAEFDEGFELLQALRSKAILPFLGMMASVVMELSIVYVSLLAVNQSPPLSAVFLAFLAANIVGVVSIIPGDVGVHEATMIIMLSAFGVPEGAAISATLLYRVFNKMIFLPIGFYFYTTILKPATERT